ncbi:TonB-dependent receptor [Chitinophaga niastensis]|nr:TonB-dependent receptor [Chitinophaga niastensis]
MKRILSLLVFIVYHVSVQGQSGARLTDTTNKLNEIIVTASRVAESIHEVPSTVTVISRTEVEKQSQINNNLPNILMQKVPGISPSEESQNNFIGKLRGRSFLVLIDGIPQSTPLRNGGRDLRSIDVSAIDHIEVINGASAMYGNGAAGGIINYITKKPAQNKPFTSTTYLNNSMNLANAGKTYGYNLAQVFSGSKDKFDYLVQGKIARSGVIRSADGQVVSPFYGLGETNSYNALAKVGYNFNASNRLEVMGNYYSSVQNSQYIGTTGKFGISPAIGVPGDTAIRGGTPYNKTFNIKYLGDWGKTAANISFYYDDMNTVFEAYNQVYSDHWGARLNFNTPFALGKRNRLTLIYGMDFLKDHTVQKDMADKLITPSMNMTSIAPYLQSKFNIADDWIVKGGLRYEHIGFAVGDLTRSNGQTTKGAADKYNALVFNLGARYNKLSFLQPFISYSQGYSIGDVGLVLRNGVPLTAINAEPVLVENYELGFSGRKGIINYQLTGYYSFSKKGTTYTEVGGAGNYELIQVPQKIYGIEAELGIKVTRWLDLGGVLGYMDGRQDTKNTGSFDGKLDNSVISPLKINANANVKLTDNWSLMLQMVSIGSRDVFTSQEYNYGKYPVTGYRIFDLYTSYKIKNILFRFSVNNLFNTNYYPVHAEVRGATNDGRYYVKGSGAVANLGVVVKL